jgi:hypothetical protein
LLFDLGTGVVLPTVLLFFDTNPFRDDSWGPTRLPYLAPAAYVCVALTWILAGFRVATPASRFGDAFAGGFAGAATIASLCGVLWLPWNVVGILLGLILGGFVPFLAAASLLRLARHAFASSSDRRPWAFSLGLIGTIVACALPSYFHWKSDPERLIRAEILGLVDGQAMSLRKAAPGAWSRALAFGAYTGGEDVDRELGFEWDSRRKRVLERTEGPLLLVFASKRAVVHSVVLPLGGFQTFCFDGETVRRVRGRCMPP